LGTVGQKKYNNMRLLRKKKKAFVGGQDVKNGSGGSILKECFGGEVRLMGGGAEEEVSRELGVLA